MTAGFVVRDLRPGEGEALRDVERWAGEQFRTLGMDWVADEEPMPAEAFDLYAGTGRGFVAENGESGVIGYAVVDLVDGEAHLAQVSVVPERQRQGVGRALIERVMSWATEHSLPAVTLTTFCQVPWNAPYYRRLGFADVVEAEVGEGLAALRSDERRRGLDRAERCCMRLMLDDGLRYARRSARGLVLDAQGRLLLLLYRYTSHPEGAATEAWLTPGGGIEPGESIVAAAAREIREETGLDVLPERLAHVAYTSGHADLGWASGCFRDDFFALRVDSHDAAPAALTDLEKATFAGFRWWTKEELVQTRETVHPHGLAGLIDTLQRGERPERPRRLPWHL